MKPHAAAVQRLTDALRLKTPIVAVYDAAPGPQFEPLVEAKGRACCFAYYGQWLKGVTLAIARETGTSDAPTQGCPGAQNALGLGRGYPPYMARFLTDGVGAPMGEGLKATPELAQEFLDRAVPPPISGDHVLIGPLRLEQWERVRTLTFFVDPDRLAALMTLAAFWSSDPDEIAAPFSSGCGLLWRELAGARRDRAVLGCTDIAMRRYLPPEILCLSVSPERFARMVGFPEGAFLTRSWWNELMGARGL